MCALFIHARVTSDVFTVQTKNPGARGCPQPVQRAFRKQQGGAVYTHGEAAPPTQDAFCMVHGHGPCLVPAITQAFVPIHVPGRSDARAPLPRGTISCSERSSWAPARRAAVWEEWAAATAFLNLDPLTVPKWPSRFLH